jgi:hypothetical protein
LEPNQVHMIRARTGKECKVVGVWSIRECILQPNAHATGTAIISLFQVTISPADGQVNASECEVCMTPA